MDKELTKELTEEVTAEYISDTLDSTDNDVVDNTDIDVDDIENSTAISYRYIFYIILIVAVAIITLWFLISMFSSEAPIVVLNQMLNNGLEITAAGDK